MTATPNRLIDEKSPYLLQHAHNPVDWQPWGGEAFNQARLEDKPVFLSIGYSTCHWCHVMEAESFEDEEVAALLNRGFVAIKVDREERPDIDSLYMSVCQMMTGSGGWPLTIILTPDKKPFFAATYLPKQSRGGRVGLVDLLPRIESVWTKRRGEVHASADQIVGLLKEHSGSQPGKEPGIEVLDKAFEQLQARYDAQCGGFGSAPKFPTPHNLALLLRHWKRTGSAEAHAMVNHTLAAMDRGGIRDQIGDGFHRYSTDADWLVPHFEKMLYDQALMILAFVEAFQAGGGPDHVAAARRVVDYAARDLTSEEGGFFSAEDADSEGEEGRFYVWTEDQMVEVLGPEQAGLIGRVYNLDPGGNFAEEATGRRTGSNIPHRTKPLHQVAEDLDMDPDELADRLASARSKLLAAREKRVRPSLDHKILTDWNGLMIAALGRAARVLESKTMAQLARRALDFITANLRDEEGRLFHRWADGSAAVPGFADDYACLAWGALELHQALQDPGLLALAVELTDTLLSRFWDFEDHGFFQTADDAEELLTRTKEIYDGALPSANSVAAVNLIRLARLTGRTDFEDRAAELIRAFAGALAGNPGAHSHLLQAVDLLQSPGLEVVVVGPKDDPVARAMLRTAGREFRPDATLLFKPDGQDGYETAKQAPYTLDMNMRQGRTTAYVCTNRACGEPTTDLKRMIELLD